MSELQHDLAAARALAAAESVKPDRARPLPLDDPFYRPRIIAERTGHHYRTIITAINAGELRATKLGKRAIGVRASEVQRWLDRMNGGDASKTGEAA